MKRFGVVLMATCLLLGVFAVGVQAQTHKQFMLETGAIGYVDSLMWSNGSSIGSSKICTLIAADRDTSVTFPVANLKRIVAQYKITGAQGGTAGDSVTYALNCSLDVSIDGQNWVSGTGKAWPGWATASSADNNYINTFVTRADSVVTHGGLIMENIKGARFGRLRLKSVSDTSDSTFVSIFLSRQYDPVTR